MYMQNEIGFHGQGLKNSCSGDSNWITVNAVLNRTQARRVENCFRAWRRPGLFRWLRYRFGQPSLIALSLDKDNRIKLVFRDEANRLAIARSYTMQLELAQIVADTLGWSSFKFRHQSAEDPLDIIVERSAINGPWLHTHVVPPRLARSTQLHYRHT